jgi:hypothetical protein
MAGENLSLGAALGLQGTPKDYTALVANNFIKDAAIQAQADKQRQARQAAQEKNFNEYRDKIYADPNQYASVLLPKVKNETAQFLGLLNDEYKRNPNNWQNSERLMKAKMDLSNNLNRYKNESDFGNREVGKAIGMKDGEATVDIEMVDAFNSGDAARYEKTKAAKGYGENPTYYTPIKKDWNDDFATRKGVSKLTEFTAADGSSSKTLVPDEQENFKVATNYLVNGDPIARQNLLENASKEAQRQYGGNFMDMDDVDKQKVVHSISMGWLMDKLGADTNKQNEYKAAQDKKETKYEYNNGNLSNDKWSFSVYNKDGKIHIPINTTKVGTNPVYRMTTKSGDKDVFPDEWVGTPNPNAPGGYVWTLSGKEGITTNEVDEQGIPIKIKGNVTQTIDIGNAQGFINEIGMRPDEVVAKFSKDKVRNVYDLPKEKSGGKKAKLPPIESGYEYVTKNGNIYKKNKTTQKGTLVGKQTDYVQ